MIKFTQKMTMHLNGGKKFSELRYDIFVDGKPTKFKRVTRTNGSPKYIKNQDVIYDSTKPDDETSAFDILGTRGVGLQDWLIANVKVEEEKMPK
jgi:hypothetical protein